MSGVEELKILRAKTTKSAMKNVCKAYYPNVTHVGLGRLESDSSGEGYVYAGSKEFLESINCIEIEEISK